MKNDVPLGFYDNRKLYWLYATKLVESLSPDIFDAMKRGLWNMGYCEHVITDEINAYLATNTSNCINRKFMVDIPKSIVTSFKKLLKPLL